MLFRKTSISLCLLTLVGCGGGSISSSNLNPAVEFHQSFNPVLTGVFIDSAVEGIQYSTSTRSGTTNSEGEFSYLEGETVVFSIGKTLLPKAVAARIVSPVDMAEGSDAPATVTTNIARLLQSLDVDGNPGNGITIPPDAAAVSSSNIDFLLDPDQFSRNADVINMVANSGSVNIELVSAEDANAHLNDTLSGINADSESNDNIVGQLVGVWQRY